MGKDEKKKKKDRDDGDRSKKRKKSPRPCPTCGEIHSEEENCEVRMIFCSR